jgi:dihydrofolate reductase
MRKVVAYELLSLDGVAESPDQFITEFDEVMQANLDRVISAQDAVLLGRRTYNDWAAFWPASEIEPFATFINGVKKFVVTSSPPDELWTNTTVADGDLAAFVKDLKQQPGADIGVHGSIVLTRQLLQHGLVDELRLVIAPAVQIRGTKLFEDVPPARLTLTRSIVSPSGYVLLDYSVGS